MTDSVEYVMSRDHYQEVESLSPRELVEVSGGTDDVNGIAYAFGWLCGQVVNAVEWSMLTGGESYPGMAYLGS